MRYPFSSSCSRAEWLVQLSQVSDAFLNLFHPEALIPYPLYQNFKMSNEDSYQVSYLPQPLHLPSRLYNSPFAMVSQSHLFQGLERRHSQIHPCSEIPLPSSFPYLPPNFPYWIKGDPNQTTSQKTLGKKPPHRAGRYTTVAEMGAGGGYGPG